MRQELKPLKREKARDFLINVVAPNYRTFADFQNWAENYYGEYKKYLKKVVSYIGNRNKIGSRIFGLSDLEIEAILDETISKQS